MAKKLRNIGVATFVSVLTYGENVAPNQVIWLEDNDAQVLLGQTYKDNAGAAQQHFAVVSDATAHQYDVRGKVARSGQELSDQDFQIIDDWLKNSGGKAPDIGTTEFAQLFRALGGKVLAYYYGEWRTDANAQSYNRHPWSWLQKYPDRIPLAAIETFIPRKFDFTGSKLHGWTQGNNTTVAAGAAGMAVSGTNTDPTIFSPTNLNIPGNLCRYINLSLRRTGAGSGWDGYLYFTTTDDDTFDTTKRIGPISQPTWNGSNFVSARFDAASMLSSTWDLWQASTIKRIRLDLGATSADAFDIASLGFVMGKAACTEVALPAEQQWAVDWELREAHRMGIDVFGVNYYWGTTGNWAGYSLDLMESSTLTERPQHCISWANHDNSIPNTTVLDAMISDWNTRFANANYWRINGKPVVMIFDFGELGDIGVSVLSASGQASGVGAMLTYIQNKLASLVGTNAPSGAVLVPCGRVEHPYWTGRHLDWVGRLEFYGASAVSGYSFTETYATVTRGNAAANGGTATGSYPTGGVKTFTDLVNAGIQRNAYVAGASSQVPHWPCVMTGRDSKPWVKYNAPVRSDVWNTQPDPYELRRALKDAVTAAVVSHRATPAAKQLVPVITIYAWNELAEGGYIIPTFGRGYSISNVFRELLADS